MDHEDRRVDTAACKEDRNHHKSQDMNVHRQVVLCKALCKVHVDQWCGMLSRFLGTHDHTSVSVHVSIYTLLLFFQ